MKLSEYTKRVLKNFATINPSLVINKSANGKSVLRTVNTQGGMYATTVVPEDFSEDVGVFDLNAVNTVLAKMPEADITLSNKTGIQIKDGKNKVMFAPATLDSIVQPPSPGPDERNKYNLYNVELTNELISKVLDFANILGLPQLQIYTDGSKILFEAFDPDKKDSTNRYTVEVGENKDDKDFRIILKKDVFKFLPVDYTMSVCKAPLSAQFESKDALNPIKYVVGVLKTSKVEE